MVSWTKEQFGKLLNTTFVSIVLKTWEEPPSKNILPKKLNTYKAPSNSKVLQIKKVNTEI